MQCFCYYCCCFVCSLNDPFYERIASICLSSSFENKFHFRQEQSEKRKKKPTQKAKKERVVNILFRHLLQWGKRSSYFDFGRVLLVSRLLDSVYLVFNLLLPLLHVLFQKWRFSSRILHYLFSSSCGLFETLKTSHRIKVFSKYWRNQNRQICN